MVADRSAATLLKLNDEMTRRGGVREILNGIVEFEQVRSSEFAHVGESLLGPRAFRVGIDRRGTRLSLRRDLGNSHSAVVAAIVTLEVTYTRESQGRYQVTRSPRLAAGANERRSSPI